MEKIKEILLSFLNKIKNFIFGFYLVPKNFILSIFRAAKEHPKAFRRGLSSLFIMGLGQVRNKQWYKAIPLVSILVFIIIIEISTSSYVYALGGEIATFPADGKLYFFRDYGGFFTRGVWGFITLGELVLGDIYRGEQIVIFDKVFTWKSADNSQTLLGNGVIAVVMVLMVLTTWVAGIRDAYLSYIKIDEEGHSETAKEFTQRIWDDFFAYVIIIPSAILILFFTLIPFLFSFLVAFTNWTSKIAIGQQTFKWTGLETFSKVVQDPDWLRFFGDVLLWTLFYAFMSSVTVYILGLIQALIIESKYVKFKKVWRIVLILPWAIPGMISLMLFRNVFADNFGLINQVLYEFGWTEAVKEVLRAFNLVGQHDAVAGTGNILWFTEPYNGNLAKFLIIVVNLWLGYPYFMLLITGVLGTIPASLYEQLK